METIFFSRTSKPGCQSKVVPDMSIGSLVRLDLGMDKPNEQESSPFLQQQQLSEDKVLNQPQTSRVQDLPPQRSVDQDTKEQILQEQSSKYPDHQDISPMEDVTMDESPQQQFEIGKSVK